MRIRIKDQIFSVNSVSISPDGRGLHINKLYFYTNKDTENIFNSLYEKGYSDLSVYEYFVCS